MFCPFQPDLLNIGRICETGLMLDKPVEIIFLKMEGICQRPYGDVGVMCPYISGHFFEYDPVHRFALLFRE